LAPGAAQPLGEVGAQPNDDASIYHFLSSQFITCRSPRISIKLAGVPYSFLLDTRAELKKICLKDKVTIAQEEKYLTYVC